ncbi:hypothetical protein AGABI2DRAFT_211754, partial [Agaricus bisporus var. bisporus H97]|uniref:hypothetical protein n=1 Tax=Agaricus bisporus var. bisporus (strain H97 / ATCC MYA-4626 / FGSC 10389) TaxID=936046 RepID=UPI00029F73BF
MDRVEQDRDEPSGGNELPTYDDLAQQNGPNSRFGRWKGWIEKRAAERYNDITPEERERRRERGWDLAPRPTMPNSSQLGPSNVNFPPEITRKPPTPRPINLEVQTSHLNLNADPVVEQSQTANSPQPSPFVSRRIEPSHLRLSFFGSRFLPHSTSQIRCVLPLHSERLLLIGHDEGLSVLDLFPQEWSEAGGIDVKSPDEAHTMLIWEGEGVFQMTVLEQGENHDGTTQGVVLLLVGSESGSPGAKDGDSPRSLRMYSLSSLSKLAKWTVAHKNAPPLDLRRPPDWQVQTSPVKKHRQQSSIARGLKSLIDAPSPTIEAQRPISYHSMLNPGSNTNATLGIHSNVQLHDSNLLPKLSPSRRKSTSTNISTSSWDVVDEAPLRWATDFVPLATANSRLASSLVTSYAIWADENRI